VDVADQLRGNYRMDRWIRQYKWWWSIWIWGYGVLLVNAYVFYLKVMDENGVAKKDRLTHLEFRREIALAWCSKDEPTLKQRRKANLPNPTVLAMKRKPPPEPTPPARVTRRKTTPPAEKPPDSIVAVAKATKDASDKKGKACAITDNSLTSTNGPYARRLEFDSKCQHWMTEVPNRPKCALHRWACGNDTSYRFNVFSCTFCMVNLCIDCFRIFHSEPGDKMVANKKAFAKSFNEKRLAKKSAK
jgi:hypothetical protein